jgi:hypothetical protein
MTKECRIEISEKFLESCATATLIGTIVMQNNILPNRVVLVFPQTSPAWRRNNNGPRHYVMPEYTVHLLIEDVLSLVRRGIEVRIEVTICDD